MTEITENVVYNCDFMKNRLPDHCADLIIADPPYFRYKGDFDFVWPTFDDYLNDVRRWGEECRRLLKDNGTLIWWGSDNRIAYTQVILDTMFLFLNSCTWNKSNGWGKVQNAEISRKFIPNAERFILYESKPEIREGEARKILRVFEYEQGMCRTRCMKPLVDYMISEMERAGFTPKRVNDALHTCMAGHWFTRGSQWVCRPERIMNVFATSSTAIGPTASICAETTRSCARTTRSCAGTTRSCGGRSIFPNGRPTYCSFRKIPAHRNATGTTQSKARRSPVI